MGYDGPPRVPDHDLRMFRLNFLAEELRELGAALGVRVQIEMASHYEVSSQSVDAPSRLIDALDALVDLEYILHGTVDLLGLSRVYDEAWRRVHAANLTKIRGRKPGRPFTDERWDVMKPPDWVAPDLADLV